MFDVCLVGKKDQMLAHFKDKMRQLKEQAEESHTALNTAVTALVEQMPWKSPIYNGVMVHVRGDVRPEAAQIHITVESVILAGE
jgi:acyl-CoA hydrolase